MLELRDIQKRFDSKIALEGISFQIKTGEIVALLGPSGSGKSTLLSIIAGLEQPDRGHVLWDGNDMSTVPAHLRGFGLMFQDYALFPHRDVAGNVAFGLEMAGRPRPQITNCVREVLDLVGLAGFERREVSSLSGGEQQRVALARALSPQPKLLMLDEPLGSLDRGLRTRLLQELADILRAAVQTSLYVTHDQEEAFAIADRIVLLQAGRIAQDAAPQELYVRPASPFVAEFLGLHNLFSGKLSAGILRTTFGEFPFAGGEDGDTTVLLRPDAINIGTEGPIKIEGKLVKAEFQGSATSAFIQSGSRQLKFSVPSTVMLPNVGENLTISFNPQTAIQLFPRQ